MRQYRFLTLATILAGVVFSAAAQSTAPPMRPVQPVGSIAGRPGWPQAKPADVHSPEAIVAAVYDVISGGANQPRDLDRLRSLFIPDARLIPTQVIAGSPNAASPNTDAIVLTIDGYIARSSARAMTNGFFEHSIHNEIQQYGDIVQVWSTYESRHALADPAPFARGINSFQLLKDGDRYWVVNIFWSAETPTTPLPAKYLPSSSLP
jgi:hypothetical protein